MAGSARVGDMHVGTCGHGAPCCPHGVSGPIVEGSPNVFTNGKAQARLGDLVNHDCPHCGIGWVSSASGTVSSNGKGHARIGDSVVYPGGGGVIVESSKDVFSGD